MAMVYGASGSALQMFPSPIIAERAPGNGDRYELGRTWINKSANTIYMLTSYAAGLPVWTTSPASGATTLSSLIVTTTSDLQGNVTIGGTLDVTGDTTLVNLSVSGDFNYSASGQLDLSSSQAAADAIVINASAGGVDITAGGAFDMDLNAVGGINIRSTENAASSIFIEADGGTSESINIHSDQGTGVESINLESDVGGITLTSGLASADAINIEAGSGGVDVDAALQINIATSQNAADAIRIVSSAGGIDITSAATYDIDVTATGGTVQVIASEAAANQFKVDAQGVIAGNAIVLETTDGGVQINADGASNGDISIDAADDLTLIAAGDILLSGAGIIPDINDVSADGVDLNPWGATDLDSSGATLTYTLGSPALGADALGLIKVIKMTTGGNNADITVTNHATSDPEVFRFDAADEVLVLMWTGTEWFTLASDGVTTP